jgi:hypothetical protein
LEPGGGGAQGHAEATSTLTRRCHDQRALLTGTAAGEVAAAA